MKTLKLSRWLLVVAISLCLVTVCQACPTCKQGIAEGTNQANMLRAYFWSILFMMSMPFLIFGGLGTYFYYQVRQARALQAAEAAATAAVEAKQLAAAAPNS
jgi:hypothetical protein